MEYRNDGTRFVDAETLAALVRYVSALPDVDRLYPIDIESTVASIGLCSDVTLRFQMNTPNWVGDPANIDRYPFHTVAACDLTAASSKAIVCQPFEAGLLLADRATAHTACLCACVCQRRKHTPRASRSHVGRPAAAATHGLSEFVLIRVFAVWPGLTGRRLDCRSIAAAVRASERRRPMLRLPRFMDHPRWTGRFVSLCSERCGFRHRQRPSFYYLERGRI